MKEQWFEELNNLPPKKGFSYHDRFAAHKKWLEDKKEKEDEARKAYEEEQEQLKALQLLEKERKRLDKVEREAEKEKVKMRRTELQQKEAHDRSIRKEIAEAWLEKKKWEHTDWQHQRQSNLNNLVVWSIKNPEPIRPSPNWFGPDWNIKEQFKHHFHEDV